MPVKSILDISENTEILRRSYVDMKMSTTDISEHSVELFGSKIGAASVYNALIRNKIPVRNKSTSVSMATSTLDGSKSFINETLIEWIDGFLLGDGSISFKHNENYMGARFSFGSSQQEWTGYAMSGLWPYHPSPPKTSGKVREKSPNPIWTSRTLTHPDIVLMAKRWYPESNNYVKKIPSDVRITPTSMMLWYLGDGSITKYGVSYVIRLATCAFDPIDLETIIIPKLNKLGISAIRTNSKNDIKIKTSGINDFFNVIGKKSPINCYNYKFEYAPWLNLYRISDIARNSKEKWRIQYMFSEGKLDCQKSPGNKLILFDEEQKTKLLKILDEHTLYNEYENNIENNKSSNLVPLRDIVKNDIERWNARYMITRGVINCEKKSLLNEMQARELREKLNSYGSMSAIPQHMIDYEFRKWREIGFPYYDYTPEELEQKLMQIRNYRFEHRNANKWDGFGCELANYFHPHMFDCKKRGKMSAVEFFKSDVDFKRGISKLLALYPKITEARIREICSNETASSRINNFPPRVMMSVLNKLFHGNCISMLDPCAGFSGRLIGSATSGIVKRYVGIDLSDKTIDGLKRTQSFIDNVSKSGFCSEIIHGNCIEIMPSLPAVFDFVFTSPPFLDEEQYMNVPVETNYDKWKNIFVEPFIKGTHCTLKHGGKLAVYTEAIRRNDFPRDFENIAMSIGYKKCDDIIFEVACRENLRKNRSTRQVKIIVFEKQ